MGDSDNKGTLRKQKGWIGYVWSNWKAIRSNWENIEWKGGDVKPKEETRDKMGKIIQKW